MDSLAAARVRRPQCQPPQEIAGLISGFTMNHPTTFLDKSLSKAGDFFGKVAFLGRGYWVPWVPGTFSRQLRWRFVAGDEV